MPNKKFNEIQYNILIRDVKLFNSLRVEKRYGIIEVGDYKTDISETDFSEIFLCGADLRDTCLIGADLRGAALREVNLKGANLLRCNLTNANLCDVKLMHANLRGAKLKGIYLEKTNLYSANLKGANISYARLKDVNLKDANLSGASLKFSSLIGLTDLRGADLTKTVLYRSHLEGINLANANLIETNLTYANLKKANLIKAKLINSRLVRANITEANLMGANIGSSNFSNSDLSGANLSMASLIGTNLEKSNLTGCNIYGVSAWDITTDENTVQNNLIISKDGEPTITVDNIEVAQFIYLLLNNQKIRDIINTITSKVVLILGRFTAERKSVLDAIREELRKLNYTPVLFDFDKPDDRSFVETVSTLAHMARFVIADFTDPKIVLQEAQHIVPNIAIPFAPIFLKDSGFEPVTLYDLRKGRTTVLDTFCYEDEKHLLANIKDMIIEPAVKLAGELNKPNPLDNQ